MELVQVPGVCDHLSINLARARAAGGPRATLAQPSRGLARPRAACWLEPRGEAWLQSRSGTAMSLRGVIDKPREGSLA